MIHGIDHIALGVEDLEERIQFFSGSLGWQLKRRGIRYSTGSGIAFLADPVSGFKIELIETTAEERGLLHLAFRVNDLEAAYQALLDQDLQSIREPHELPAAKARTALLADAAGFNIQLIQYEPDSPDL